MKWNSKNMTDGKTGFVKSGIITGMTLVCSNSSIVSGSSVFTNYPFKAGAAKTNITPAMDVPLDGVIQKNSTANDIHYELFARCLVL